LIKIRHIRSEGLPPLKLKNNIGAYALQAYRYMNIFTKNTVSIRYPMIVEPGLQKAGVKCLAINLGSVEISGSMPPSKNLQFGAALSPYGRALVDNEKSILMERIENVVIEMRHYLNTPLKINFFDYLRMRLKRSFS